MGMGKALTRRGTLYIGKSYNLPVDVGAMDMPVHNTELQNCIKEKWTEIKSEKWKLYNPSWRFNPIKWKDEMNKTVRKYRRILITIKILDPKFFPYKPQVSSKMEYINFKNKKSMLDCKF